MAPGGGGKRKRGDRTFSHDGRDDSSRPSPHRPSNLSLAQQNYTQQSQAQASFGRDQYDQRGGGRRRGSRGGRGGGPQRSPINSPNGIPVQTRSINGNPKTMSPPSTFAQTPLQSPQGAIVQPNAITATAATQTTDSKSSAISLRTYEYITDERLDTWIQSGKNAVVEIGVSAYKARDSLVLCLLFQELIRSCLDSRIAGGEAGSTVKHILEKVAGDENLSSSAVNQCSLDPSSLFLDCLSIVAENSSNTSLLQSLILATGISPHLMRCELDSTLLESLGLIRNTFVRVGIRQQTNLLYRQSNYNLLREETEGYSKLVTELFTTSSSEPLTSEVVEDTFEKVKGMIGAFDLDVGRVLDVTLDVFAAVLVKQYRFFVKYLRASSWWPQHGSLNGPNLDLSSSTLPKWALPGSSGRPIGDDEKEQLTRARDERDRAFWERVGEIGIAAFFEIGGRRVEKMALEAAAANTSADPSELDEDRKWIETTGTLPPLGNKVAAQVLGFKLRFYSSSARDPSDVLPVNLIYLAALLIKVGFISLRDLYPHLWPADEAMEGVKEEKMRERAEKEKLNRPGGGTMNALMTAGALVDDSPAGRAREAERLRELEASRNNPPRAEPAADKAAPAEQEEEKEELPEPSDQKVQLLKSLLCIGALPESLYMLGRFPWLPDAFPDLPEHIHRILHHCLSKVYEPLRPLKDRVGLREQQKVPDSDQSGTIKGQIRLVEAPARKILRWAQIDKDDTNEAIDYRFYWDDWADNIPVCQSVDDVFLLCSTLLNYTGVKIGQDAALLLKLSRIGYHSLNSDPSEANMARWTELSKRIIVPSLSLTKCNPGVVNEVFELIKNFTTTTRYSIYAEWYSGQVSRLPDIKAAFEQAKAETKDVLKRISKTSVKPMARALAKVAYASPGVVFAVAIAQIESYDNLVETVVECARYFTYLGYDVLTWSLMSSLGGRGRTRVQADGMLTSRWLAALSLFAGRVFKRYSMMSPTPILQYVAEQLRQSNSTDLIVLEEITSSMAGIVSDTNFNESQVIAMSGGDLLQSQTMLQLLDRRHESKTTARRLIKSLVEPKLAGRILVAIAQERQTCVYKIPEPDAHLKLLGNLFDELHRVLVQYLDLLRSNLSIKDFDLLVPSVSQLINDFGIEPSVAFWISRPSIAAAMTEHEVSRNNSEMKSPAKELADSAASKLESGNMASEMNITEMTDQVTVADSADTSSKVANGFLDKEVELETSESNDASHTPIDSSALKVDSINHPWHPVLRELMDSIRPALPEETWDILSQPFYVTFWQLSLRDMLVPTQSYDDEINRQKKRILAINSDRTDLTTAGTARKEREKKALTELQDRLRAELKDQVQSYSQTRLRLQKEKEHWFSGLWGKWDALNVALIEHCFFPRTLMSPVDAMYAFKMLKFLHSSGATNFRTMGVLDQFFKEKRLISMFFLCTAKEAENFGRFLNEVLRDLSRWHADKAIFEKEAFGTKKDLPGFSKKMTNEKTILSFWDYEEFRRVLLKWHRNLNTAIKACISSGEYMHIRNAINLLKAIYQHFPAVNWMGQGLVISITELSRSEAREDLKIAATSLLGNLKRREKDWVLPQAFNLVSSEETQSHGIGSHNSKNESATNGNNGARIGSTKPTTPQPDSSVTKALNPKAVDFLPNSRLSTNGNPKSARTTSGKFEVEDGEIEDAKLTDQVTKDTTLSKPGENIQLDPDAAAAATTTTKSTAQPLITTEPIEQSIAPQKDSGNLPAVELPQVPNVLISTNALQPNQEVSDTKLPPSNSLLSKPAISSRPELDRTLSANTTNNRLQHTLPNRPEPPIPKISDHRMPERLGERTPRDYVRDTRFPERSRSERPGDSSRDRPPDQGLSVPYPRGYEQNNERSHVQERNHIESGWIEEKPIINRSSSDDRHSGLRRDGRPLSRDDRIERSQRDRSFPESQHHISRNDIQGQSLRDVKMAPPRSNILQHPDRAALMHGSHDPNPSINNQQHLDRRLETSRYENYSNSERIERSSRGASPARPEDRRHPRQDGRRDDHFLTDSRRIPESHPHTSRYEESHLPTGPRTERPATGGPSGPNDRFRESVKPNTAATPASDSNHSRMNQDQSHHNRQEESQYGRLNTRPDIPSGPRLPNGNHHPPTGRGNRTVSAPQSQNSYQHVQNIQHNLPPPLQIPDKQAPVGPSTRGTLRNSGTFPRNESTSTPPTPANESPDTAGVHPDRLKAIQGQITSPVMNTQSQGNLSRPTQPHLPSIAVPTPAGPRGPSSQLPSPVIPSPTNRGPPTGPSFGGDRNRGDKRFASLQNVLQQANGPNGQDRSSQGATIRGRGGRTNNVNASPSNSGPPTPSIPRLDAYATRADLFAGRSSGPPTPQHNDDEIGYGRGARRMGSREMPRDSDRRPERHKSNRSHSREKATRSTLPLRDDEMPPRRDDLRDRPRGGPSEREMRRLVRDDPNRDRRLELDRRDIPEWASDIRGGATRDERERREGGGSGRKRGRIGDEVSNERNYADNKRPRRMV